MEMVRDGGDLKLHSLPDIKKLHIKNNPQNTVTGNTTKTFVMLFRICSLSVRDCEGLVAVLSVALRICGKWAQLLLIIP